MANILRFVGTAFLLLILPLEEGNVSGCWEDGWGVNGGLGRWLSIGRVKLYVTLVRLEDVESRKF